ncbi:MAG: hypothetical protein AAGC60_00930 [Acidobacteriota bacterium]
MPTQSEASAPEESPRSRVGDWLLPWLVMVLGLGLTLGPMWTSRLAQVPGDSLDARLVHFSLEHAHRFVLQQPAHESFWDPPLFYPARNVAAYTDTLLGFVPLYTPWRLLGATPTTAFQLWVATVLALTFWAGVWTLRRLFDVSLPAACAGAYVFAFAGPRAASVVHPQLLPWFLWALSLLALGLLLSETSRHQLASRGRKTWIGVLTASLVAQAYGAFYPFFFFVFVVGLGCLLALMFFRGRHALRRLVASEGPALAFAASAAALLLAPLAQRYLLTVEMVGSRELAQSLELFPRPLSWLTPLSSSHLFGRVWHLPLVREAPELFGAPHLAQGLGLLTPGLALVGLWAHRQRQVVRLLVALSVLLFVLTVRWPGDFTLWQWVHAVVPGASAIRATSRFGLCLLVPAALGVALLFQRPVIRRRPVLGLLLFAALAVEQRVAMPSYYQAVYTPRVEALAAAIGPECEAFYVILDGHRRPLAAFEENAMWAALVSGTPTLNGRYGNEPPGWQLALRHHPPGVRGRHKTNDAALRRWLDHYCIDRSTVCRLLVDHTGLNVVPAPWGDLEEDQASCAP